MLDCLPARLGNFSNAATQQSPFVPLISSTPSSKDEQAADVSVRGVRLLEYVVSQLLPVIA